MVEEQLPIFTMHSLLQFLHLNQENWERVLVSIFAGIKFKSMSKKLYIFLFWDWLVVQRGDFAMML